MTPATDKLVDALSYRNERDKAISQSVIDLDEYRLKWLFETGFEVRVAVDVGGHVGSFTRLVKHYWPRAKVIAVEPDATAYMFYRLNTDGLSNIRLHATAITAAGGASQGRLMLSLDGNGGGNFLAEAVAGYIPIDDHHPHQQVSTKSILEILACHGSPDIDLLKLDCEGPEAAILMDLHNAAYLPRVQRIVGEWHHFASVPLIQAALQETHELELYQHDWPWGAFFASPRRD